MSRPLLLIITGPPGAGKSTLAKALAPQLELPLFSKDEIKESLFDTLGWQDRDWSKKLGIASLTLLFHCLACELQRGQSVIAENAFIPAYDTARFLALQRAIPCEICQVYCTADDETLYARFRQRATSGERHPGHVDHLATVEQFKHALAQGRYGQLALGGARWVVDTGAGKMSSVVELVRRIKALDRTVR